MERGISISVIIIGLVLILNSSVINITGNIVDENIKIGSSVLGFVFLFGGLALFLTKEGRLEKNLAQQILESGKILRKPREFIKIAARMGYSGKNVKEGYQVLDEYRRPLTVIPKHEISKGVHYNILKALATGESNFRRRSEYQPA